MLEQLGLGIVLTMEDNFTPQANTAIGSMTKLQTQAEVMTSHVKASLDNLHHVMLSGFSLTTLSNDFANEGKRILGTFKEITSGVTKTGREFETIRATMKVFFDDYEDAVKWGTQLASTTPFEIKDVMDSMTAFKAIGLDVRKEVQAVSKEGEKMSKSMMEYIGDLGALRPDQGLQGALMAIRELSGGNTMSFKRRFDIDPEDILGRKFASASSNLEQFEKDLAELSAKLAPNLMGSLFGTMNQEMSNLSDSWEIFKLSIADAGAFDAVKGTIRKIASMFGEVDFEATGKAISSVITTLWTPIDMLVTGIGKVVQGVLKFIETFPGVSKAIGVFIGIYGVTMSLTGVVMNLAGKFIILGASITSAYLNFKMLSDAGLGLTSTLAPLVGGFKTLVATFTGLTLGIAGLALAWNTNFLGIRDVGVKVANEIGNRWSMANSIVKEGLQDFKNMTLDDKQVAEVSAKFNMDFKTSGEATDFLDNLQEKAMVIARPLSVMGSVWTALFGKKNKDGLVIFSESQIRALRDTGMLTMVQTLVALRGRVEAFFKGFKEGAKSFIGVMKEFMNLILIPIKPVLEGIKKVIDPVIKGFKNLFGIVDDEGMDLTEAEKQVAMMEKIGKAVGFIVGAIAGFKVVKGLSGLISTPFKVLSSVVSNSHKKLSALVTKFNSLNPLSKKRMVVDVDVNTGKKGVKGALNGQVPYNTNTFTPASRKVYGYNYVNPNTLKGNNDTRLKGQDTTNVYAKKRMFGLGGQTLYSKNADGSMKNLGTRGGVLGGLRDKAKNYNNIKGMIYNGQESQAKAYNPKLYSKAKKSLGTSTGTLEDVYRDKANAKGRQAMNPLLNHNKRNNRILSSYKNGETIGNRKTYDGMWKDVKKDTGMYYSDFGKGKQGEIERTRFLNNYMKEKQGGMHSKKDLSRAYKGGYNRELNNLLGDNAQYKDSKVYKKKRNKASSFLFGDKYQVAEKDSMGNTQMRTVAKTGGILTPMTNKVKGKTKTVASNVVNNLKTGTGNLYSNKVAPKLTGLTESVENGVNRVKTKGQSVINGISNSTVGQKVKNSSMGQIVTGQKSVKDTKIGQTIGRVTGATSNAVNTNPYLNSMRGFINNSAIGKAVNNSNLGQSVQTKGVMGTVTSGVKNSAIGRGVGTVANNFKQTGVGRAIGNVVSNPLGTVKNTLANPMLAMGRVGNMGKNVWGATKQAGGMVGKGVSKAGGMVGNAVLGKKTYGADGQYTGRKGGALGVAKKGMGMMGGMARGAMGVLGAVAPWAMVGGMVGGAVKNAGANLSDDRKADLINKSNTGELPVKLTADSSDFDLGLAHISDKVKNTNFGEAFDNLLENGGRTFALLGDLLKNVFVGLVESAPQIISTLWDGLKNGANTLMTILPPIFSNIWTWITTDGKVMFQNFLNDLIHVYIPTAWTWIQQGFSNLWTWITTDGVTVFNEFVGFLTNDLIPMGVDFMKEIFGMAWNWITTDGVELLGTFINWLVGEGIPNAVSFIFEQFGNLWEWVKTDGIDGLMGVLDWLWNEGLPKIGEIALDLGKALLDGMANAISNLGSVLWGAVKSAFAGAVRFALPAVLEEPVLDALGLPTHHGGLYMSPNEHIALIRKDETVLPPDKSRQLDDMMRSGSPLGQPVVAKARGGQAPAQSTDNSVSIQNLEIKIDAKNLSRTEAREQAMFILEELKKINKEREVRQYA